MTAATELLVGDDTGDRVRVRALTRAHPDLFDPDDANWVACEIEIAAGGFYGSFPARLRAEDFGAFLEACESLSRTLEEAATLSTLEGQLTLVLTGDGRGHVAVRGTAADTPGSDNRLQFAFDLDQTSLTGICRSLGLLVSAFP